MIESGLGKENLMAWIAPIAIAAKKQRQEEALDRMQQEYGPDWEFKVMDGIGLVFASREKFRSILEQEARAGWQLETRLNDGEIVVRRPIRAREQDALLPPDFDPYRTEVGQPTLVKALVVALVLGLVLFTVLLVLARFI
jgi:hypothetical protein